MVDTLAAAALALTEIAEPNVKLAVHVAPLVENRVSAAALAALHSAHRVGSLFAAATSTDPYSTASTLTHHAPLASMKNGTERAAFAALLKTGRPGGGGGGGEVAAARPWVVVDASMPNMFDGIGTAENAEFAEVAEIEAMLSAK